MGPILGPEPSHTEKPAIGAIVRAVNDSDRSLEHAAPMPARGSYADGYEPVAHTFAQQLASGEELGAGLSIYRDGKPVVDLWGGLADREAQRPWERDTRIVLFSVTKGFAAMAMALLTDRGLLDPDATVASYWPEFGHAGKEAITVRTLLGHRAGLAYLDAKLTLEDCVDPSRRPMVRAALERQRPAWAPGEKQGYHALTYGLYVSELFEQVAGEPMAPFLRRELLEPLGSDAHLGAPPELDAFNATLYPVPTPVRLRHMVRAALFQPDTTEGRATRALAARDSVSRRAFSNPAMGKAGIRAYESIPVRRSNLAWASATASADGIARAYLPFAADGEHEGRRYLKAETLAPLYHRQSWSERDVVLQKPVGWSLGFLKEERHLFCPNPESFGHAGIGGTLGWADPIDRIAFGYSLNRSDWRIRSPRAIALCRALYESPAMVTPRAG
jgi:CubicO group peptidase (beta-lactamase class C family)